MILTLFLLTLIILAQYLLQNLIDWLVGRLWDQEVGEEEAGDGESTKANVNDDFAGNADLGEQFEAFADKRVDNPVCRCGKRISGSNDVKWIDLSIQSPWSRTHTEREGKKEARDADASDDSSRRLC